MTPVEDRLLEIADDHDRRASRMSGRKNVAHERQASLAIRAALLTIGTLRAERDAQASEIERLQADGIHSCNDECPRTACVLRREIAGLKKQAAVNPTTPYGPPTINFRQTGVGITVSEWYSVSEAEPMRLLAIAKDALETSMLLTPGYTNEDLARHITTGLAAIDAAMREGL